MPILRIGLLSDIHGNLAALRAVRAALSGAGHLDRVIVAGDLLQGGPRPREVWETLVAERWGLVQGNEDAICAGQLPAQLDPEHPFHRAYQAQHAWTLTQIDASIQRVLGELPREHRVATSAGYLLVVHSSPRALDDRAGGPHNTAAEVDAAYAGTGAAAIAGLARQRLPHWSDRIWIGNVMTWSPPRTFDFVRTELVYVPPGRQPDLIRRLLLRALAPGGRLLVCSYGSSSGGPPQVEPLEDLLRGWGFLIAGGAEATTSGGVVITCVIWVDRPC